MMYCSTKVQNLQSIEQLLLKGWRVCCILENFQLKMVNDVWLANASSKFLPVLFLEILNLCNETQALKHCNMKHPSIWFSELNNSCSITGGKFHFAVWRLTLRNYEFLIWSVFCVHSKVWNQRLCNQIMLFCRISTRRSRGKRCT